MRWQFFADKYFLSVILLSLILRLALASLPGLTFDMSCWLNWSERLQQVDFSNFYTPDERTDYLPGYLYILYILSFTRDYLSLSENTYLYLLKLPGIFSEVLLAVLVYLILIKSRGRKIAQFAILFISFNPAFVFNSAVWGQIDSIFTFFLLLAIFNLSFNKAITTAVFFGISIIIKPQSLLALPVFFLNSIYNYSILRFLKIFSVTLIIIIIFSLPFFENNILIGLLTHIQNTANEYPYNSLSAYNLWGVFGFWKEDTQQLLGISYYRWGIILYFLFWVTVLLLYLKRRYNLYILTSLAALSFYFLPTRVHDRYLYPALVFLFICSFILKNKTLVILTTILSLLHVVNLLHVYLKYNGFLLTSMQYLNPLYQFLEKNITLLSLISTFFFILISIVLLKINENKRTP